MKLRRIRHPAGGADCSSELPPVAVQSVQVVGHPAQPTAGDTPLKVSHNLGQAGCGLPSELPRAQPVGQVGALGNPSAERHCRLKFHNPAGGADCRPSCRRRSQSGRSGLGNPSAATRRSGLGNRSAATRRIMRGATRQSMRGRIPR